MHLFGMPSKNEGILVRGAETQVLLVNTTVLESGVVCMNCFIIFSKIIYNNTHSLRHLYVPSELHIKGPISPQ